MPSSYVSLGDSIPTTSSRQSSIIIPQPIQAIEEVSNLSTSTPLHIPPKSQISIIPYSSLAYKPLILDDAQVPETVINLLSTQTPLDPLDLAKLEEDLLDWRERMRWAFLHRFKQLLGNGALSQETPFSILHGIKYPPTQLLLHQRM
jgi:hypothetical protein